MATHNMVNPTGELELLHALVSSNDVDRACSAALDAVVSTAAPERAAIRVVDHDGGVVIDCGRGRTNSRWANTLADAAAPYRATFVEHAVAEPRSLTDGSPVGAAAYAVCPLSAGACARGWLTLEYSQPHAFSPRERRVLEIVAGSLAQMIGLHLSRAAERAAMQEARLSSAVGVALTSPGPLVDHLRKCTDAIVEHLDAAFARIWLYRAPARVLELVASSGCYTHLDGQHSRVPLGAFKIGRIALTHRPHISNTVTEDPEISDCEWARREGMVAFAGYPLLADDQIVGVVALFARHELPATTTKCLAAVADTIALGTVREQVTEELRHAEAESRRFSERYKLLMQATHDAVFACDFATDRLIWGEGVETLFGYRERDVPRGWWKARIHPDDRQRVVDYLRNALSGYVLSFEGEYRFRHSDGSYRDVLTRGQIARDEEARATWLIGAMQDITERKRQSQEVERLAERLSAANAAASVGTWRLDLDTNQMFLDAGLNRLLGARPVATVEPLADTARWIHPADLHAVETARGEAILRGAQFDIKHRIVRANGEVRWIRDCGRVIARRQRQPTIVTGAVADITDLKRAEQSMAFLAEASRLLSQSLDYDETLGTITQMAIPFFADGVLVHLRDPETDQPRLAAAHASDPDLLALMRDLQQSGTYRAGAGTRRVLSTRRSELHRDLTEAVLREDAVDEFLRHMIRAFGISSLVMTPILVENLPVGVIVLGSTGTRVYTRNDVVFAEELARRAATAIRSAQLFRTSEILRQRAEEAGALRERLLAIVGHDLRGPLSAVAVASEMLGAAQVAPAERKLVRQISASAQRMSRMITQLLDFARIRQGMSLPIELVATDLHELCASVVEELRLVRGDRPIELDIAGDGTAICDPDRVAEALSNVIGNALQHSTEGPVHVTVRDVARDAVAIEVHNLGAPIPPEVQTSVFEAFRRGGASGRSSHNVGLGLYIAREVARAHGGAITIRSPDRDGTTFRIVIARGNPARPAGTLPAAAVP